MILLSAFFSGSEILLASLSPLNIPRLYRKQLLNLYKSKNVLITTMLIGNNITVVFATISLDAILKNFDSIWALIAAFFIQTTLFFLLGEVLPKNLFLKMGVNVLIKIEPLLKATYFIFRPLSFLLIVFTELFTRIIPDKKKLNKKDIISFIGSHFIQKEVNISKGLMALSETRCREIMTSLPEICSININSKLNDILQLINQTSYTRYPLYKDRGDNIVGYINTFDLINFKSKERLSSILYQPEFVPDTLSVDKLLFKMIKNQLAVVFVVNEYGSTLGMITLENIAEEIIGNDIISSVQKREVPFLLNSGENLYELNGNLDIDDFNDYFGLNIQKDHFETISGYIYTLLGRIPVTGEELSREYGEFQILKADKKTIYKINFQPAVKKIYNS